jgi:hypothetical protein
MQQHQKHDEVEDRPSVTPHVFLFPRVHPLGHAARLYALLGLRRWDNFFCPAGGDSDEAVKLIIAESYDDLYQELMYHEASSGDLGGEERRRRISMMWTIKSSAGVNATREWNNV